MTKIKYVKYIMLGLAALTPISIQAEPLCPQATLSATYTDPESGFTHFWFDYAYGNPTYDTLPPQSPFALPPWDVDGSVHLQWIKIYNSSEGEWFTIFGDNDGVWANWWIRIYPLKNDPKCNGLSGKTLINCQNMAFANVSPISAVCDETGYCQNLPPEIMYGNPSSIFLESHLSGPFLSDTGQCEWYMQGQLLQGFQEMAVFPGTQFVSYSNFVIWDWNSWFYSGNSASQVWVEFDEGDNGFLDDTGILTGMIGPDGSAYLKSDYAEAVFTTFWDSDDDDDGLEDNLELQYGSDPHNPDTDQDGLNDGAEVLDYQTNPLMADTDADELSDGKEVLTHTNPLDPDTDDDGIDDGEEIKLGLNPLQPDNPVIPIIASLLMDSNEDNDGIDDDQDNCPTTANKDQIDFDGDKIGDACDEDDDNDDLSDVEELSLGTDPKLADTDGDTLTDSQEVENYHTDPLNPDSDGDALSDGEEFMTYQSNPLKADTDENLIDDGKEINLGLNPLQPDNLIVPIITSLLMDDEEPEVEAEPKSVLYGDLDDNGKVTVTDVQCMTLVALAKLGKGSLPECLVAPEAVADVNCDEKINVTDNLLVIKFSLTCPTGNCPGVFEEVIDQDQNGVVVDGCETN